MATKLIEDNKIKCAQYFPDDEHTPLQAGAITVTTLSSRHLPGLVRSQLLLRRGDETRTVLHYWY